MFNGVTGAKKVLRQKPISRSCLLPLHIFLLVIH